MLDFCEFGLSKIMRCRALKKIMESGLHKHFDIIKFLVPYQLIGPLNVNENVKILKIVEWNTHCNMSNKANAQFNSLPHFGHCLDLF